MDEYIAPSAAVAYDPRFGGGYGGEDEDTSDTTGGGEEAAARRRLLRPPRRVNSRHGMHEVDLDTFDDEDEGPRPPRPSIHDL